MPAMPGPARRSAMTVADSGNLLFEFVKRRDRLAELSPSEWEALLNQAEQARLLGRVVADVEALGIVPNEAWLRDRLVAAAAVARDSERAIAWEINRLGRAFLEFPHRWVLLKGAGYVAAGLPPARGRRVADLDVLVPEASLPQAEAALRQHGWEPAALSEYDERFYRDWMHELPPMAHTSRRSVIDLHHAILPRVGRLHPDSKVLIDRAVPAQGALVLCPSHMVIHAAVHLFHDGEISGAERDLVDLDALFRTFGTQPGFWDVLVADAEALGVGRPVFYAMRYAERLLETPIPVELAAVRRSWAPSGALRSLMDQLVERTLRGKSTEGSPMAALALYVRSHWLRMPPLMLARHLAHQALTR